MRIPFFGEKNSEKIEKVDSVLIEVQTEMNMTSRKIEMSEKKAKDLMKKAVGSTPTQRKMLALQIKKEYDTARVHGNKLRYYMTVYSAALSIKQGLESRELATDGALKALSKIMGAGNLSELKGVMRNLAKEEQKLGGKLAALQAEIDATQEELAATDMTDDSFLDIMKELDSLPPEKIDETINTKVKFEEKA